MYSEKSQQYFGQTRLDFIELISSLSLNSFKNVLDIGCGSCETMIYMKEKGLATRVEGVELCSIPNSNQGNVLVDKLNIGEVDFVLESISNKFDLILFLDVLEHLVDPWSTVMQASHVLDSGGYIIISCPNIREIKNWFRIFFKGSFKYEDAGIMDKTHLRFFAPKDLKNLLPSMIFQQAKLFPNYKMAPNRGKFRFIHLKCLDEFFAPKYFLVAKKAN